MRRLTTSLGVSAILIWQAPASAATPEETLYRWGECAIASGVYRALVKEGTKNPIILKGHEDFERVVPKVEQHTNTLARTLGSEASRAIQTRMFVDYDARLNAIWDVEDSAAIAVKTFGPILDRCLIEAAALPKA